MSVDLFLDIFWIITIYAVSYHGWHIFLEKHSNVLIDIGLRYNDYRMEQSTTKQHDTLYILACTTMMISMLVSPIVHSIMYLLFYNMVDVVKINTILLTIVSCKILWYLNLRDLKFYFRPWNNILLVLQFVFICINFTNAATAIPSVFQLVDEMSNTEDVLVTMMQQYTILFNNETSLSNIITNMLVKIRENKKLLHTCNIIILGAIIFVSFLFSNLKTNGEIMFYYYAIARIMYNYQS